MSVIFVFCCYFLIGSILDRLFCFNEEEGGDDVKLVWFLWLGLHTSYNGRYRGQPTREGEPIPESRSQSGLESATRLHEVGIASNRESAMSR